MKRHITRSIQTILSSYFALFSLLLLALTVGIVSWMQYRTTRRDTIDTLHHASIAIADSIDQQINQMNQISLGTISSAAVRGAFTEYFSEGSSAYEHNQQRRLLANALVTEKGFDFSIRQLNVYTPEGSGYGAGEINGDLDESVTDLPWYAAAENAKGHLIISVPERGPSEEAYVSACRMFYNSMHVPMGFAEVKKAYDTVFGLALNPEVSYPVTIAIYDTAGNRLYPLSPEPGTSGSPGATGGDGAKDAASASTKKDTAVDPGSASVPETAPIFDYYAAREQGDHTLDNTTTGYREYVCFSVSPQHHLVIAAASRESVFLRQVYRSMQWILSAFLALLLFSLLISMILSRQISSPIRRIYHFLADDSKEKFQPLEMECTGIREIDKLKDSINENIRSVKASTDTLMVLKEKEVQAQMLALQSQMNPHFLYNSLSTISEMAQEGLTQPVSRMCDQIIEIMRYISSNREQRSSLEEELEICDMYLDCIGMRYGDQLVRRITVPDDMLEVQVPKLCIQLLVENAVRSATTLAPPWQIEVSCEVRGENWYVTVSDNGPGFDPEVEKGLRAQMDQILADGILPSLKIQGMGLLNIFIRLYLLDGIPFIFDMGNRPGGGAFVTIGGKMHASG